MCTYVAPDGTTRAVNGERLWCKEKGFLHYDHIVPFSLGGKSEASNLRLLCSCHNAQCAEEVFGKAYITKKISVVSLRKYAASPGVVKSLQKPPSINPKIWHFKS